MPFTSSTSNIIVKEEPVVRKTDFTTGNIPVFDSDKKLIDSLIPASLVSTSEQTPNKGQANGYAPLDASAKIDISFIPSSLLGSTKFKGFWNATTNIITSSDPALNGLAIPASSLLNQGFYFIVTVAGNTNISGITDWSVGDWIISLGTAWGKVDNTDAVVSVNGQIGIVVLTKTDVGLGNVQNLDQTNAANITSGTLNDLRLSANVVNLTGVQTLTNKTLTSPKINVTSDATGDIYYRNAGGLFTRLAIGATGRVLTVAAGIPSWAVPAVPALELNFSNTGVVSGTVGALFKASINTSGSGNTPTTNSFDVGFNNGGNDPYLIAKARTLVRLYLKISGGAVSGAGPVVTVSARFRVFEVLDATRVQLGADIDIPLTITGIGIFNDVSASAFQFAQSGVLAIAIAAGKQIGIEFVNVAGSAVLLNAVRRIELVAELT